MKSVLVKNGKYVVVTEYITHIGNRRNIEYTDELNQASIFGQRIEPWVKDKLDNEFDTYEVNVVRTVSLAE